MNELISLLMGIAIAFSTGPALNAGAKTDAPAFEGPRCEREMYKPPRAEVDPGFSIVDPDEKYTRTDGDVTQKRNESEVSVDADAILEKRKNALDARYAAMFALKNKLDKANAENEETWREYEALRRRYEREYERLLSDWARLTAESAKG